MTDMEQRPDFCIHQSVILTELFQLSDSQYNEYISAIFGSCMIRRQQQ